MLFFCSPSSLSMISCRKPLTCGSYTSRQQVITRPPYPASFLGYRTLCLVSSFYKIRYTKAGAGCGGVEVWVLSRNHSRDAEPISTLCRIPFYDICTVQGQYFITPEVCRIIACMTTLMGFWPLLYLLEGPGRHQSAPTCRKPRNVNPKP